MVNLIIILSVFFSSLSQLFLKKGADNLSELSLFISKDIGILKLILALVSNVYIFVGVSLQVFALLIWIYVLKKVDVSYAYPFIALGFVFVFTIGVWFFNEKYSLLKLIGILTIVLGVVILGLSGSEDAKGI